MIKFVVKKDKTIEPYSEEKIIKSLERIGASKDEIKEVLSELHKLPEKITTKELFRFIYQKLKLPLKTKYNLKKAITLLGPSGYPFEHFIAHLLGRLGYQTETNIIVKGKCVNHELDVIAQKGEDKFFIESKFHLRESKKNDVKIILYFYGRIIDLYENNYQFKPWLWTNTKFTQDAIDFALCRKIKLTASNYPSDENLFRLIDKTKAYPVTILTCLKFNSCYNLIKSDIILVEDLLSKPKEEISKIIKGDEKLVDNLFHEARFLMQ